MKSLVSIPDFVDVLEKRERGFYDSVLPASQIRMSHSSGEMVLGEMVQGRNTFGLQEQALDLVGVRLRIPASYMRRCPCALRAENVNYWLEKLRDKPLFIRFDKNEIRAILTTRYTPVSNLELVNELGPRLQDAKVNYNLSARRMVARIVTTEAAEMKVGDVVRGGLVLLNSEVGFSAVEVSSFLYRLVCANGLVVGDRQEKFRRIHTRQAGLLVDELHSSISGIVRRLPESLERFRTSQGVFVSEERAERLLERAGLTLEEFEAVQKAWASSEERTAFSLINAFTGAANEASGDSRLKLQQIGGRILAEVV